MTMAISDDLLCKPLLNKVSSGDRLAYHGRPPSLPLAIGRCLAPESRPERPNDIEHELADRFSARCEKNVFKCREKR